MKFLEMETIAKANYLLIQIKNKFMKSPYGKNIEIEAYSCKNSKLDKTRKSLKKPLKFLIGVLELSFINFEFNKLTMESFEVVTEATLLHELNYEVFLDLKCKNATIDCLHYLKLLFNLSINIKHATVYRLTINCDTFKTIYLIYNKKMKRILLVKIN